MTALFLLLLLLAALVTYRWHLAERDVDYWRSEAMHWQTQCSEATREMHGVYRASLDVAGEVWLRRRWFDGVQNVHDN